MILMVSKLKRGDWLLSDYYGPLYYRSTIEQIVELIHPETMVRYRTAW